MKFLHLMMNEKFTKGAAVCYDKFFNNGQHEIGYVHPAEDGSLINPELTIPQYDFFTEGVNPLSSALKFKKLLKEYDYIVLHSLIVLGRFSSLLYFLTKKEMKKLVWIEWGSDLYDYDTKGFKKRLKDRIRKNIGAFIAIFPPDKETYKKMFPKSNTRLFYGRYFSSVKFKNDIWDTPRLKLTLERGEPIYVLIGHNGQEHLNHIETLRLLGKYKKENIKLILSLSYGGTNKYIEEVSKEAKRIFGDKVIILSDFIPKEEYFELMERIDIALFNTKRQSGLGNIYRLLVNKVKVYLRSDGVMYDFFKENCFPVNDCLEINNQEFSEFTSIPDCDYNAKALDYLKESVEKIAEKWEQIYKELEEAV